jgi:hypothetical protein
LADEKRNSIIWNAKKKKNFCLVENLSEGW